MPKRSAGTILTLKELAQAGLQSNPFASPFAVKIPKVNENVAQESFTELPVANRKRKRSVTEDGDGENDSFQDDNAMEFNAVDENLKPSAAGLQGAVGGDGLVVDCEPDPNQEYYESRLKSLPACTTFPGGLPPTRCPIIHSGYFSVDDLPFPGGPEKEVGETGSDVGSNHCNRFDEDDSNEEDNWRNEYPDEDDFEDDDDDDDNDDYYEADEAERNYTEDPEVAEMRENFLHNMTEEASSIAGQEFGGMLNDNDEEEDKAATGAPTSENILVEYEDSRGESDDGEIN